MDSLPKLENAAVMKWVYLLGLSLMLSGLPGKAAGPESKAGTLAENNKFPRQDIEKMCKPAVWRKLRNLEYTGYVVLEGQIDGSGQVKIRKTTDRFPDDSRNQLAVTLANNIALSVVAGSSKISPRAKVYVVFYERLRDGGNLAFIFAQQLEFSNQGKVGNMYLNTIVY